MLDPQYIQNYQKIDGVYLSQKECEELIKEYIGIKLPTYYQINSFINALSGQLKKFSLNFQLSAGNLIQVGNFLGKQNLKDIRVIMVNGFIKNTQHFTQGAFNKLLNSQLDTYKVGIELGIYNEDKQNDIAIKALSKNKKLYLLIKLSLPLYFFMKGKVNYLALYQHVIRMRKNIKIYLN